MPGTRLKSRESASTADRTPMRAPTRRVLVVGDDMQSFLTVARSLGRAGIVVHAAPFNWSAPSLLSRYIVETHRLPRIQPATEVWVARVRALMDAYDYDLIIPCSERSLLPLWANRDKFPPGRIGGPGDAAMACLFDKIKTREVAEKCDVPVAKGRILAPADTGARLIAEFGTPLFLKTRNSFTLANLSERGSVHRVETAAEADAILAGITERESCLVETGFSSAGSGVGISVIAQDGRVLQAFQHRRLREKPGGGASSIRISEPLDADMLGACKRMVAATCLHGVAMFEFRHDSATNDWILLEVNARFWGSVGLAVAAGIDFPVAVYNLRVKGRVDVPGDYRTGLVSANSLHAIDHLMADPDIGPLAKPFLAVAEISRRGWRWARGKEHVDELAHDDLRPGIHAHLGAVGRLRSRLRWNRENRPERRGTPRSLRDDDGV